MHVVVAEGADHHATRLAVKSVLRDHGITHSTIETESPLSGCADDAVGQAQRHH